MASLKNSFKGTFEHSLDPKNRLFIPASYRNILGDSFVLYRVPEEHCLFIYSSEQWDEVVDTLVEHGRTLEERRKQRKVFAYVTEVTIDSKGRITIPQKFCDHAQLDKNVLLIGNGRRVEVWDANLWENEMEFVDNVENASLDY